MSATVTIRLRPGHPTGIYRRAGRLWTKGEDVVLGVDEIDDVTAMDSQLEARDGEATSGRFLPIAEYLVRQDEAALAAVEPTPESATELDPFERMDRERMTENPPRRSRAKRANVVTADGEDAEDDGEDGDDA